MALLELRDAGTACVTRGDFTVVAWAAPVTGIGMEASGIDPVWLSEPDDGPVLWPSAECAADQSCFWMFVHSPSRAALAGADGWVAVTGHFNDPAAQTCRPTATTDDPEPASDPVALCVSSFVVVAVSDSEGLPSSSVWSQNPPEPLLLGAAVRSVVDKLYIRARPSTSAKRLGTLTRDNVIALRAFPPPVDADGYVWYYGDVVSADGALPPLPQNPYAGSDAEPVRGWFATSIGTTAYVRIIQRPCPEAPDLRTLAAMLPAERLGCFGARTIELTGILGCVGCNSEIFGTYEPAWLADPNIIRFLSVGGPGTDTPGLSVRLLPFAGEPAEGVARVVTGQFSHEKSDTCSITIDAPWTDEIDPNPTPQSFATLWCQQMFVVTGW